MPAATATANLWPLAHCAKAFWAQQLVAPHRELLADTLAWADPRPGERWLDLGCGSGPLSRGLWEASAGGVAEVVGADCAAVNADAYARLRKDLVPPPGDRLRFLCHDFSDGLAVFDDGSFDHVISGLAVSYAESFDAAAGRWTDAAYDRVLAEVCRVLKPGGKFVFSVNVPNPSWGRIARGSLPSFLGIARPLQQLKRAWRMLRYGRWLKREANRGRFHYLPAGATAGKLTAAGFTRVEHRVSFRDQAFVFRARKPDQGAACPDVG